MTLDRKVGPVLDERSPYTYLNDKKFDQALKKVNQLLEKVFVDAELHYIAFIANSESGNKEKAEFHKDTTWPAGFSAGE